MSSSPPGQRLTSRSPRRTSEALKQLLKTCRLNDFEVIELDSADGHDNDAVHEARLKVLEVLAAALQDFDAVQVIQLNFLVLLGCKGLSLEIVKTGLEWQNQNAPEAEPSKEAVDEKVVSDWLDGYKARFTKSRKRKQSEIESDDLQINDMAAILGSKRADFDSLILGLTKASIVTIDENGELWMDDVYGSIFRRNLPNIERIGCAQLLVNVINHLFPLANEYKEGDVAKLKSFEQHAAPVLKLCLDSGLIGHPTLTSAISGLSYLYEATSDYESLLKWRHHAVDYCLRTPERGPDHIQTLTLSHLLGGAYHVLCQYDNALKWYQKALAGLEKHPDEGPGSELTLDCVNVIGVVYMDMGDYDEAEKYYRRAVDGLEKLFGKNHPTVDIAASNLAMVYRRNGDEAKALPILLDSLARQEEKYGKGHIETSVTLLNLGVLYEDLEQHDEALRYYERVLAIREKNLEEFHPGVLLVVSNMGIVYRTQERYDEALSSFERALAGYEHHDKDHPKKYSVLNSMGKLRAKQGDRKAAMDLHQRAYKGTQRHFGEYHKDTRQAILSIANLYFEMDDYVSAAKWFEKAFNSYKFKNRGKTENARGDYMIQEAIVRNAALCYKKVRQYEEARKWINRKIDFQTEKYGTDDHLEIVHSWHEIACTYFNEEKYEDAREWYERCLPAYEKYLHEGSDDYNKVLNNIGTCHLRLEHYEKSKEIMDQLLPISERESGCNHEDTIEIVSNLAECHQKLGDLDEAICYYQRALSYYEKLGEGHDETIRLVCTISIILRMKGELEQALKFNTRALASQEKVYGKDSMPMLRTTANRAIIYDDMENFEEALKWHERALTGKQRLFGADHPSTIFTLNNLGELFLHQDPPQYDEALKWHRWAAAARENVFGASHNDTITSWVSIAEILEAQSDWTLALEWHGKALEARERTLGPTHFKTIREVHDIADCFENMGNEFASLPYWVRARKGYEEALGTDNKWFTMANDGETRVKQKLGMTSST